METTNAVQALAALANEARLELFRLLVRVGSQGLPAGELATRLDVAPATLSSRLAQLTRCGLLKAQREGRVIRYAVNYAGMQALIDFLADQCCSESGDGPEACSAVSPQNCDHERSSS